MKKQDIVKFKEIREIENDIYKFLIENEISFSIISSESGDVDERLRYETCIELFDLKGENYIDIEYHGYAENPKISAKLTMYSSNYAACTGQNSGVIEDLDDIKKTILSMRKEK